MFRSTNSTCWLCLKPKAALCAACCQIPAREQARGPNVTAGKMQYIPESFIWGSEAAKNSALKLA